MHRVIPGQALHGVAATRRIETQALAAFAAGTLMERAGTAAAHLALALAPHARAIWVACGPGNNGGDGLVAARLLRLWGMQPIVTLHGHPAGHQMPVDAQHALQRARDAGVVFGSSLPQRCDLVIDALLGIGIGRPPTGEMAAAIEQMNRLSGLAGAHVLALDVPSGLNADTGQAAGPLTLAVQAQSTLSFLTAKPGLFTAHGRDLCGDVWVDDLEAGTWVAAQPPTACLGPRPGARPRLHASHKGSFGNVWVVGGAAGMTGAAWLAGSAALHGGAGRVFVHLLAGQGAPETAMSELMVRRFTDPASDTYVHDAVAVCGCGGSSAVSDVILDVFSRFASGVLDADAINSVASRADLRAALLDRSMAYPQRWVLTPHPLEAARLLGCPVQDVQADRLAVAQRLADLLACTVVLKGSGTVIAAPAAEGRTITINPTGNARLASAGTGDVLAGLIGAHLAAGLAAFDAACRGVYEHGAIADAWDDTRHGALTAGRLARALAPG